MLKSLPCLSVALLLFGGCSSKATQPTKQPATPSEAEIATLLLQPATVTEVFHLRGECVALGNKMEADKSKYLKENEYVVLTRANYSVSANHCYVLIVEQHELSKSTALYDGQTEKILAATVLFKDGSPSRGYMGNTQDGFPKETDYSKVADFINRLMDDGEPKQ